jgi:hypothetical protein
MSDEMALILTELRTLNQNLASLIAHVRDIAQASRRRPTRPRRRTRSLAEISDRELQALMGGRTLQL